MLRSSNSPVAVDSVSAVREPVGDCNWTVAEETVAPVASVRVPWMEKRGCALAQLRPRVRTSASPNRRRDKREWKGIREIVYGFALDLS